MYVIEMIRNLAQSGRALALGASGRWFNSSNSDWLWMKSVGNRQLLCAFSDRTPENREQRGSRPWPS